MRVLLNFTILKHKAGVAPRISLSALFTMTIKASDSDSDSEPEDEDNEDYLVILTQTVNQSVNLHFALSHCFPFPLFINL